MWEGLDFLSLGIAIVFLVAKVAKVADFTGGAGQKPVAYVVVT